MNSISLKQGIAWAGFIVMAVGTATFALTKYSNTAKNSALEDRLKYKDEQLLNFKDKINTLVSNSGQLENSAFAYFPAKEIATGMNDPAANDLLNRIEDLEQERLLLLSELSNKATASLDPRSELANLLAQLQSSEEVIRTKAIEGLFALKDPLSFSVLVNFLMSHPDEATSGKNPNIFEWFIVLIEAGGAKGAEFVANQLGSTDPHWAKYAYEILNRLLDTSELIDGVMPSLESMALRHSSTVVRTKTKVLINRLVEQKAYYEEQQYRDNQYERRMVERKTIEQIPSNFIIISILKENGFNTLANDIILGGGDLSYWKTGLLIAKEFSTSPLNQNNCIRAIEGILDRKDIIASSSEALLFFLLSQMKSMVGDSAAAASCLAAAREVAPQTVDFFVAHESAFGAIGKEDK